MQQKFPINTFGKGCSFSRVLKSNRCAGTEAAKHCTDEDVTAVPNFRGQRFLSPTAPRCAPDPAFSMTLIFQTAPTTLDSESGSVAGADDAETNSASFAPLAGETYGARAIDDLPPPALCAHDGASSSLFHAQELAKCPEQQSQLHAHPNGNSTARHMNRPTGDKS